MRAYDDKIRCIGRQEIIDRTQNLDAFWSRLSTTLTNWIDADEA